MPIKNEGYCRSCHKLFPSRSMTKHLLACPERPALQDALHQSQPKLRPISIYHLLISGYKHYWLHLAVKNNTTLHHLDAFLRAIWLECCGHLSSFSIAGVRYEEEAPDEYADMVGDCGSMQTELKNILGPDGSFKYEYDFGSTTDLSGKVVAIYDGYQQRQIEILARNEAPEIPCQSCGQPATVVDSCEMMAYCKKCAKKMIDEPEMTLPVVNSPRAGVCGYEGEREDIDPYRPPKGQKIIVSKGGNPVKKGKTAKVGQGEVAMPKATKSAKKKNPA
jgi:hypothetical protein